MARVPCATGVALTITVLTIAVGLGCGAPTSPASERPNVLLVTVDTLRLDRIGSYGGRPEVTPHIDALAAEGVRFASVQAPRGLTWPSLTTLLTGLHPRTHGVRRNGGMLAEEFATLPEILQRAGYDTGAFLANMCDAPNRGLRVFRCAWWEDGRSEALPVHERLASHDQPLWDAAITRDGIAFVRQRRAGPFFAWLHYMDPHKPFDPVPKHLPAHYEADGALPLDDASLKARTRSGRALNAEERRQLLAVYDSQVAAVDAQVGRLLAALADAGLAEHTLVVFSADHGEELGDHHVYFFHRGSVYQQVLAVPLILRWPGSLPAGAVAVEPIAAVDVTPTVLDLVGLEPDAPLEGASRAGLARREPGARGAEATFAEWSDQIVVVGEGSWRFVWNPNRVPTHANTGARIAAQELYDLSRDPLQRTNLAASEPERAAAMKALACSFVTRREFREGDAEPVADDVRERLAALGYTEEETPGAARSLASHCGAGDGPAPPNVLLVSVDTLRRDMLGAYGYPRPVSPNLDRLAAEGVVFENALATSPWTLPSNASLLTGLYPSHHGMKSAERRLPGGVATWAQHLQQRGYATGAVVNSQWMSDRYDFDRGFDEFELVRPPRTRDRPGTVIDRALQWLDDHADEPFFLFVHHYHVHSDYTSLPEHEALFVQPYAGSADGTTAQLKEVRDGRIALDENDRRHLLDLYVAGIHQVDEELGRLLAGLEAAGRLDDTLVIVTSDHGEEFLEHGSVLHGRTQYEEVLAVPLILRGPGVPAGRRVTAPVSLVDVLPTALSLLGKGPPQTLDGRDLSPLWRDPDPAVTTAFTERVLFGEADHNNHEEDVTRSARRGRFKLVTNRLSGEAALYDLELDPGEQSDVSAQHPEVVRTLREALNAFSGTAVEGMRREDLSAEEREQLRALGYLED